MGHRHPQKVLWDGISKLRGNGSGRLLLDRSAPSFPAPTCTKLPGEKGDEQVLVATTRGPPQVYRGSGILSSSPHGSPLIRNRRGRHGPSNYRLHWPAGDVGLDCKIGLAADAVWCIFLSPGWKGSGGAGKASSPIWRFPRGPPCKGSMPSTD